MSAEEEEQLWQRGVLSSDTPGGLLRAVFFYNGINFVLRGGEEHRRMKISQLNFRVVPNPDSPGQMINCVEYTECGSKNRPGDHRQLNLEKKGLFSTPGLS